MLQSTASPLRESPRPAPTATVRRKELRAAIGMISDILDAESGYLGRRPENFHGCDSYDDSQRSVEAMVAALELLDDVYA